MRLVFATAFLATATASSAAADPPIELVYRPVLKPGTQEFAAMEIALQFPGDRDGVTDVDLPNEWGGFSELYRNLSNIKADGAEVEKGAAPDRLVLRHKPGATVALRYVVNGVPRPDKLIAGEDGNEYRPIINPEYFQLLGNVVVPQPTHIPGDAPVQFRIEGLPAGAAFVSDLQHGAMGRRLTFSDLIESVSSGGDFRIVDAGNGARLAIRGSVESRDDAGWAQGFGAVAKAITGYWERPAGPYLVTILPFEPAAEGHITVGGTGRGDAFAFFASRNADPETIDKILAHEMGHSWVPRRIGNLSEVAGGGEQSGEYWLSEGFTDFTTWRAMVRAGLWTPEQFAAQWNEALAEYDALSTRELPNAEAAKLFWTSREGQRLPYLRGMLFASWLDDALRGAKHPTTLRNVLLAMQARAGKLAWDRLAKEGNAIGLLRKYSAKAGVPLNKPIANYITDGKAIAFSGSFMAPCGAVQSVRRAKFHRGFDVEKTIASGGIIMGVVPDSPAWKAGVRDGMKLLGRVGGEIGNSAVELAYEMDVGGEKKILRWMPEGEGEETYRRLVLDQAKTASCKAYLSN